MLAGLTQYGSSEQTIAIADQIARDSELRTRVMNLLTAMGELERYSNQRCDQRAQLSSLLADAARKYSHPHLGKAA